MNTTDKNPCRTDADIKVSSSKLKLAQVLLT